MLDSSDKSQLINYKLELQTRILELQTTSIFQLLKIKEQSFYQ